MVDASKRQTLDSDAACRSFSSSAASRSLYVVPSETGCSAEVAYHWASLPPDYPSLASAISGHRLS